jgi:hypothetical protein
MLISFNLANSASLRVFRFRLDVKKFKLLHHVFFKFPEVSFYISTPTFRGFPKPSDFFLPPI